MSSIGAVPAGGLKSIVTADIVNAAVVDFTGFDAAKYTHYKFVLSNIRQASDYSYFRMRTSSDGGATFDAGASAYKSGSADYAYLSPRNEPNAQRALSGAIYIHGAGELVPTMITGMTATYTGTSVTNYTVGSARDAAAVVNAVRFYFSAGNIVSGKIEMLGFVK